MPAPQIILDLIVRLTPEGIAIVEKQ